MLSKVSNRTSMCSAIVRHHSCVLWLTVHCILLTGYTSISFLGLTVRPYLVVYGCCSGVVADGSTDGETLGEVAGAAAACGGLALGVACASDTACVGLMVHIVCLPAGSCAAHQF